GEEALRASQSRLSGVIESAMDAILTVDAQQRILLFNRAAEKMFGCSAREALGQSLNRFIPERFRPAHGEHPEIRGNWGGPRHGSNGPTLGFAQRWRRVPHRSFYLAD